MHICMLELNVYHLNNSLPQKECDKLLHAAEVGDINVISTMITDGVDMNAVVKEVDTCTCTHKHTYK